MHLYRESIFDRSKGTAIKVWRRRRERELCAERQPPLSLSLFASYDAILLLFEQIHSRLSAFTIRCCYALSLFLSLARLRRGEGEGIAGMIEEHSLSPSRLIITIYIFRICFSFGWMDFILLEGYFVCVFGRDRRESLRKGDSCLDSYRRRILRNENGTTPIT